jgi:hypothetical protein
MVDLAKMPVDLVIQNKIKYMPSKSKAQRAWMQKNLPSIAEK